MAEFESAYPLILNKVASPHFVTPTLRRARLLEWLHQAANCRATVIAADAGYGKTTLLWQWEREVDFPCYWYKLDRNDRDWTLHVSYLAQAVAQRHHGFGRRTHSMLQQVTGPGVSRPGVAAYLLAEMHERLTEPCTFIIDDWQYVNAVTEVRGLWNQILRDAPPTCRFVFASRAKPRLQFARFKTHEGYAELNTDALRFNSDELDRLFREIYQEPLGEPELAQLERRTEGWAASLHLVSVSLRDRTPEERKRFIESVEGTSNSDLFEFLAEEVVDQESADTRSLLLSTSILQQITPELAERLAGVQDGIRELLALEHRGLFTYRLDEGRYRYHNLFREYLEKRLLQERSEAEVVGLHIHAASYFETTEDWPKAIHHYLRAGLQRQAARLVARHGEQQVAEGRLGLIGEWLDQLPDRAIRENARLSLLLGEFAVFRGEWNLALEALTSAREFFAKKGDRRMEALACVKLSTVLNYRGDTVAAAAVAQEGLDLVPVDDVATRLRLEGNVAITHGLAHEHLESVAAVCRRIATEASAEGLDHFAAIGEHNYGFVQLCLANIPEAVSSLERASRFWDALPPGPLDDRESLTRALLAMDRLDEAERVARRSLERARHWRLTRRLAMLGWAEVLLYRGRFGAAADLLMPTSRDSDALGFLNVLYGWTLVKALYLAGAAVPAELEGTLPWAQEGAQDERFWSSSLATAMVQHMRGDCSGQCMDALAVIRTREKQGYRLEAIEGTLAMASAALDHRRRDALPLFREGLIAARDARVLRLFRWWSRRSTPITRQLARTTGGIDLLVALLQADPDGWRVPVSHVVSTLRPETRRPLLAALENYPGREAVEILRDVRGVDVADLRHQLHNRLAPRLYVRTFGGLSVHKGSWTGAKIQVSKRRLLQLLCLLVANIGRPLGREYVADTLWPEADAISSTNSLNQAVFQLRRLLDPSYRDGEGAAYLISDSHSIQLNPELVQSDLDEVRRLSASNRHGSVAVVASRIELVKGEFLPELKYEDWGMSIQAAVHTEVRALLLPVAERAPGTSPEDAAKAAMALVELDAFDERAQTALARAIAAGGRRMTAHQVLARFATRFEREMDAEPGEPVRQLLADLAPRAESTTS